MKKNLNFLMGAVLLMATVLFASCNAEDDFLVSPVDSTGAVTRSVTTDPYVIDFANVPAAYTASDKYGANLYTGGAGQITEGYKVQLGNSGTYVQFPVNYLEQEWGEEPRPWQYDYWNGGLAVSDYTDITDGTYLNQCSVYNGGIAGVDNDKFVVAYGYSDFYNDPLSTYDKCAKIYLTDATGYTVVEEGTPVEGTVKTGTFNSVYVCNTTYSQIVMRDGNSFTTGGKSLEEEEGWFKVEFIGFASSDTSVAPTGKVTYYLANFDKSKEEESGLHGEIRTGWNQVDLTDLGTGVHMVVVNFVGSDKSDYGLNTPAYCALDNLSISL